MTFLRSGGPLCQRKPWLTARSGWGFKTAGHGSQVANLAAQVIHAVVVVAWEDFRGLADEGERRALSAQVLQSLLVEGGPLPLFSRACKPSKKNKTEVYRPS